MSRIGNKAITIPDGVTITINDKQIVVKGSLGELQVELLTPIKVTRKDQTLIVQRSNDEPKTRGFHGLTRALIANAITGVTQGFNKRLDLKGVGYKAEVQGNNLVLNVGFSHPVNIGIPDGIKVAMEKATIVIHGINKQQVGQFAASVRTIRPPEPYKGKGIRYSDEIIKLKPGKQAAKAGAPA